MSEWASAADSQIRRFADSQIDSQIRRFADPCYSPSALTTLTARDELSGEDVVPGFTCRVGELFE
jgi:hypothetical protein